MMGLLIEVTTRSDKEEKGSNVMKNEHDGTEYKFLGTGTAPSFYQFSERGYVQQGYVQQV
jgi:hypothetical protein